METYLVYPLYVVFSLIMTLIYIPRQFYKDYFIYGLILGALGDIVIVAIFQNIFHIIQFKNGWIFMAQGQNILSPPAWLFTVMIFLWFLPGRRWFRYIYIMTFAAASVAYGYLVHNAGLFDFKPWFYPALAYVTFLGWWCIASWVFNRTSNLSGDHTPH